MEKRPAFPRCRFIIRYPAPGGKWRFERGQFSVYDSSESAPMQYPPLPGDGIILQAPGVKETSFTVVQRSWLYASYGSGSWPYGSNAPLEGPLLDIIVEPALGLDALYASEAPSPGDENPEPTS